MFDVKHLLSSGHSALFIQLHPCLLEVGCIIFSIVENNDLAHISTTTITQLYCIFIKDFQHFMMFQELEVE